MIARATCAMKRATIILAVLALPAQAQAQAPSLAELLRPVIECGSLAGSGALHLEGIGVVVRIVCPEPKPA